MASVNTDWLTLRAQVSGAVAARTAPHWLQQLETTVGARNFSPTAASLLNIASLLQSHRNLSIHLGGRHLVETGLMASLEAASLSRGQAHQTLMALARTEGATTLNLEDAVAIDRSSRLTVRRLIQIQPLREVVKSLQAALGVTITWAGTKTPLHQQSARELDHTLDEALTFISGGKTLAGVITDWGNNYNPSAGNYLLDNIIDLAG